MHSPRADQTSNGHQNLKKIVLFQNEKQKSKKLFTFHPSLSTHNTELSINRFEKNHRSNCWYCRAIPFRAQIVQSMFALFYYALNLIEFGSNERQSAWSIPPGGENIETACCCCCRLCCLSTFSCCCRCNLNDIDDNVDDGDAPPPVVHLSDQKSNLCNK